MAILYVTDNPRCNAKFYRISSLRQHELSGKCFVSLHDESQMDHVLRLYAAKFSSSKFDKVLDRRQRRYLQTTIQNVQVEEWNPNLQRKRLKDPIKFEKGWALPARKSAKRFTPLQENVSNSKVQFLSKIYQSSTLYIFSLS